MSDANLVRGLNDRIAATERELNLLRRELALAPQNNVSNEEIERQTVAVEACERRLNELHMDQIALPRVWLQPQAG
jgi:hypothetical protein